MKYRNFRFKFYHKIEVSPLSRSFYCSNSRNIRVVPRYQFSCQKHLNFGLFRQLGGNKIEKKRKCLNHDSNWEPSAYYVDVQTPTPWNPVTFKTILSVLYYHTVAAKRIETWSGLVRIRSTSPGEILLYFDFSANKGPGVADRACM